MQIVDLGVAVVVVDEDAGAAALAAADVRERGRSEGPNGADLSSVRNLRTAVFVSEPGSVGQSPALLEFCREQFGAAP